jgi:hypothetical protein
VVVKKLFLAEGDAGKCLHCLHLAEKLNGFLRLEVKAFMARAFTVPSPL